MESINFFIENKTLFTIIHLLGVVMGMGSALISDILFNFYSKDRKLNETERSTLILLSNIVWISLVFIILSGTALFLSDPQKYMISQKFISKMFIMVVLLVNGLFLHKLVSPHFSDRGLLKFKNLRNTRQIAFACGAVSLVSWTIVCILGVLKSIPYKFTDFLLGYLVFTIIAIIISLIIEMKSFNIQK